MSGGVCHCVCVSYQGKVGFGDGAVLEVTVHPTSGSLVEGNTKSPTGWEIQLMTEPGGKIGKMMRSKLYTSMV